MKTFTQFIQEDAPANAAGTGGVAGIGVGPKGEPGVNLKKKYRFITIDELKDAGKRYRAEHPELKDALERYEQLKESQDPETFAGTRVFEVSSDAMQKSLRGKNPYHRYSRYVGADEVGETIRAHGRAGNDVILKDAATAVMTYLKRRKIPQ